MVNTEDLKSSGHCDLVGSSPIPGTIPSLYQWGIEARKLDKYIPVTEAPIFFFMKSTSETIGTLNGFKHIRVFTPKNIIYYIQRGKHIWIRT